MEKFKPQWKDIHSECHGYHMDEKKKNPQEVNYRPWHISKLTI